MRSVQGILLKTYFSFLLQPQRKGNQITPNLFSKERNLLNFKYLLDILKTTKDSKVRLVIEKNNLRLSIKGGVDINRAIFWICRSLFAFLQHRKSILFLTFLIMPLNQMRKTLYYEQRCLPHVESDNEDNKLGTQRLPCPNQSPEDHFMLSDR